MAIKRPEQSVDRNETLIKVSGENHPSREFEEAKHETSRLWKEPTKSFCFISWALLKIFL